MQLQRSIKVILTQYYLNLGRIVDLLCTVSCNMSVGVTFSEYWNFYVKYLVLFNFISGAEKHASRLVYN